MPSASGIPGKRGERRKKTKVGVCSSVWFVGSFVFVRVSMLTDGEKLENTAGLKSKQHRDQLNSNFNHLMIAYIHGVGSQLPKEMQMLLLLM